MTKNNPQEVIEMLKAFGRSLENKEPAPDRAQTQEVDLYES